MTDDELDRALFALPLEEPPTVLRAAFWWISSLSLMPPHARPCITA
jgi:hypothetical protein